MVLKTGKHSLFSSTVGPAAGLQVPILSFSIYYKLDSYMGIGMTVIPWIIGINPRATGDRSTKIWSRGTLILMSPNFLLVMCICACSIVVLCHNCLFTGV